MTSYTFHFTDFGACTPNRQSWTSGPVKSRDEAGRQFSQAVRRPVEVTRVTRTDGACSTTIVEELH